MLAKLLIATATVAIVALPSMAMAQKATDEVIYVIGAIHDPANTDTTQDPADAAIPALPVVYDDSTATPAPQHVSSSPAS